jgi:ectoine hydroxylase-related dioxygenase (phytanoyl-CoA dioxygenase family)
MGKHEVSGVSEIHRNADDTDLLAEEIREVGYTIVTDVVDATGIDEARRRIEAVYERQVEELGGPDRLALIDDSDIVRCPLSYDDFFVDLAANARVREVVERILGTDYFVVMAQNGVINRPSEDIHQHRWHRDLQYRHFTSSRPLAISALYALDDFSATTGGTNLLPGSHRSEQFPSPEFAERHSVVAEAPAGSVLIFDSMMFHRTGINSSGRVRRAVNNIFTLPMIQQQISIPRALGGRFSDDPRLRRLLGYEAPPSSSALEWRLERLERAGAAARANGAPGR